MQLANTLQFRKAVRKVLKKRNITVIQSYTNMSTIPNRRTVGFCLWGHRTNDLVAAVEKKLNKKGLTAVTRITTARSSGIEYIRGSCTFNG